MIFFFFLHKFKSFKDPSPGSQEDGWRFKGVKEKEEARRVEQVEKSRKDWQGICSWWAQVWDGRLTKMKGKNNKLQTDGGGTDQEDDVQDGQWEACKKETGRNNRLR